MDAIFGSQLALGIASGLGLVELLLAYGFKNQCLLEAKTETIMTFPLMLFHLTPFPQITDSLPICWLPGELLGKINMFLYVDVDIFHQDIHMVELD